MNESMRLLIDSNVWVDSYLPQRDHHTESFEVLRAAYDKGALLFYGATKLETLFYIFTHEFKRVIQAEKGEVSSRDADISNAFAWGCIENIREIATAVGADEADVWLACKYKSVSKDFEDNMVLAAAERAKADYIVTWDQGLLKSPLARTATPAQMLEILKL